MSTKKAKKWSGGAEICEVCSRELTTGKHFIDGKTSFGPWALMCEPCHRIHGYGLGLGKGQKYLVETKEWVEG